MAEEWEVGVRVIKERGCGVGVVCTITLYIRFWEGNEDGLVTAAIVNGMVGTPPAFVGFFLPSLYFP